jgi:hypothetical protein
VLSLPPAFQGKAHLVDPTGALKVWITDPPGMLDHLVEGSTFTAEAANWLVTEATDAMMAYGKSRGVERFVFVHDWRGGRAHDSSARLRIIGWGRRLVRQIERIDIAIAEDAPALFRMAVFGGTMAMSVLGVKCEVHTSIDEAVAAARVLPARL